VTTATRLQSIEVHSQGQVQCMRVIRNTGIGGYSHDNREISAEEQRQWWLSMKDRCHAWLYAMNGTVVGFGMLRQRPDKTWTTSAGVLPEHAGRGYGGWIVDNLVDHARGWGLQLWAEAKLDNPAAVKTHHPDRWESLGQDDEYAYFKSKP
jgi:GNAT superfamily N-acetyltransferase